MRPRLTNRANLPEAIVDAVTNDSYSKGDAFMSVTGLLKPPRMTVLEEKHASEIVEDASDRIWSLLGQAIHTILERANRMAIAERRLFIDIDGVRISGQMDALEENGVLTDYKITSVWKLIKGDLDEWEKQLNLYSVILRANGDAVNKLQVVAILRDWSKMEALRDPEYPQAQVVNINIPMWENDKALEFMKERVSAHKRARTDFFEQRKELPECTKEERWARPDVYAVMKAGRKTAVKLYDTPKMAKLHVGFDRTLSVTHRPGMNIRCNSYCAVASFCKQYQDLISSDRQPDDGESSNEDK